MSDAPLSQEAIDALLAAAAKSPAPAAAPPSERAPASAPPSERTPAAEQHPAPVRKRAHGGHGRAPASPPPDLEAAVRDLEVELVVVLGSAEMAIGDVLRLGPGSIVELDRDAALPVEVKLAGRTVARAEVVTVDDAYALRIVENLVRPQG